MQIILNRGAKPPLAPPPQKIKKIKNCFLHFFGSIICYICTKFHYNWSKDKAREWILIFHLFFNFIHKKKIIIRSLWNFFWNITLYICITYKKIIKIGSLFLCKRSVPLIEFPYNLVYYRIAFITSNIGILERNYSTKRTLHLYDSCSWMICCLLK